MNNKFTISDKDLEKVKEICEKNNIPLSSY